MYHTTFTTNPASAIPDNANHAQTRNTTLENRRRQESLDSYVPYVDYVPGRDI